MATVLEYRLGSTAPLIIQLEQEDGTALALAQRKVLA